MRGSRMVETSFLAKWEEFCSGISRNVEILQHQQHDHPLNIDTSSITSTLLEIMQQDNLCGLWSEVFGKVAVDRHIALLLCDTLFRAHRVIAQHLHTLSIPPPECIYQRNYMSNLAVAYLAACSAQKTGGLLLESICTEGRLAIITALLATEKDYNACVTSFPPLFCLEILEKAVSYYAKPNVTLSDTTHGLLVCLLQGCTHKCSVATIIQRLFFKRASSETFARALINAFPSGSSFDIVRTIARIWSEPAFISKGNIPHHIYLSTALTSSIPQLTKEQLHLSLDAQVSLLALLSRGVSRYLDAPDARSRKCGMQVATSFSTVLEQELSFEVEPKTDDTNDTTVVDKEDDAGLSLY